jgi:hypothetical protein
MPISTGTVGAVNELRIANSLLLLGWSVYRALSPNSPYDLVATKGRRTVVRIQCKSSLNGQYQNLRIGNADLLAIATSGEIQWRARSKKIAKLFPACGIARKPKRQK